MSPPLQLSAPFHTAHHRARLPYAFVAERLWLDFVNTDSGGRGTDALNDFGRFVSWLEAAEVLDAERAGSMQRRALQQPAGALAVLGDARRVRAVLRALAERGAEAADALIRAELERVRRCADPRCGRVFQDETKNGRRRWCDMATCGNRAKAARHRMKLHA